MARILYSGITPVPVAINQLWARVFVPAPIEINHQVLLTSRILPNQLSDDVGPRLIYPTFSQPVYDPPEPGFYIWVVELDRRVNTTGAPLEVIVDWALIEP
jgi:hypothetical protein